MRQQVSFDAALPLFVQLVISETSLGTVERNLFLRDASGRLTFIVQDGSIPREERMRLSNSISLAVAPYVDDDGFAVSTPDEIFDESLGNLAIGLPVNVRLADGQARVRLLDRRVVGADWLQRPTKAVGIPRLIFGSLKGGVGRSTALCVAASALAARGSRVLAIDMDVEAPGIGSMLLGPGTVPKFGLLDYLVEANFGRTADEMLPDLAAPSWLAGGDGVIDVVPALGAASFDHPGNVISKIARAYVSGSNEVTDGVTARMQSLLDTISASERYDVILVDARAGLHETTGAALLGLGGHMFLFGTDQPQTFAAYELLFASFSTVQANAWDGWISVVQAKASPVRGRQADFASRFRQMLTRWLVPETNTHPVDLQALRDVFDVEWDDDAASVDAETNAVLAESGEQFPVSQILENELFRDFDPLADPDRLSETMYAAVYGSFLEDVMRVAGLDFVDLLYE